MLTAFSFGYEGWGPHTETLVHALDDVEASRGFAPPLLVDIRIRREVRAEGFRGNELGKRLGDRHVWMPQLGNRCILTGEDDIVIDEPQAAASLLDLIMAAASDHRRVVFFCSCGPIQGCHRQVVASLLLKEAARRGLDLEVVEWPGAQPQRYDVTVSEQILDKVAKGRKFLPLPDADPTWFGTPWYSTAMLSAGERTLPILTGPAQWRGGWSLPVLAVDQAAQGPSDVAGHFREAKGLEPRRAKADLDWQVHPYCVYHIRHSETLRAITNQPNGEGTLLEKGDWTSVAKLLQEADHHQERLLMVLDNAEEFVGINWVARIDGVRIEQHGDGQVRSLVQVSGLQPLMQAQWFSRSELMLRRTGKRLDGGYLRGKLICHTPGFLLSGATGRLCYGSTDVR